MTVTLHFSLLEAKSFFESAGLEVKQAEIPVMFEKIDDPIYLTMWTVTNPHTGMQEQLDTAFLRCVIKNRENLISDINKVMIYNSFR